MKIRLLMNVGMFHNMPDVKRGDVVEVDDDNGRRYCNHGIAEPVFEAPKPPPVEKAVAPKHETAALKVPPEPKRVEPEPLDEPEEEKPVVKHSPPPVKRRPGR